MHFSNKPRQRARRPGCDAKPHSRRPPAEAERIRCLSKHSSGNLRCRNASKHSLASHRENCGPGKEKHILTPARLQGPGQSIPPCTQRYFGKDFTDLKQTHCHAKKQLQGQRETPPVPSGFIMAPEVMSDRRVLTQIHFSLLLFNIPN